MPTYDYQCKTCGKTFEYFQSISAQKLSHCPEDICDQHEKGKGEVERKISGGTGLIFNGEGFYLTDYVKKNGSSSSSTKKSPDNTKTDSGSNQSSSSSTSTGTATPSE